MFSKKVKGLLVTGALAIAFFLGFGQVVKADSLDISPTLSADGTLTANPDGTFTLTFTLTNTSSTAAGIDDFSLELFGGGPKGAFTVTSDSGSGTGTGFEYFADTKQNNGSGNTCNSTTNDGWLCVDYSGGFDVIPGDGSLTYSFTGTYNTATTVQSPLELMAQGCYTTNGTTCSYNGANSYNISHPMDGTTVPEPGSLMLLGTGLLGLGGLVRRKLGI